MWPGSHASQDGYEDGPTHLSMTASCQTVTCWALPTLQVAQDDKDSFESVICPQLFRPLWSDTLNRSWTHNGTIKSLHIAGWKQSPLVLFCILSGSRTAVRIFFFNHPVFLLFKSFLHMWEFCLMEGECMVVVKTEAVFGTSGCGTQLCRLPCCRLYELCDRANCLTVVQSSHEGDRVEWNNACKYSTVEHSMGSHYQISMLCQ